MKNYIIITLSVVSCLLLVNYGCGSSSGPSPTTTTTTITTTTTTSSSSTSSTSTTTTTGTTTTTESALFAYYNPQSDHPDCVTAFYRNPPTMVGDYIYIGMSNPASRAPASSCYFFKFDKNLNKIWGYALGSDEVKGGAVLDSEGNIYFTTDRSRSGTKYLIKLNSEGTKEWEVDMGNGGSQFGTDTPAISADDVIYAGFSHLNAYDTDGNELPWTGDSGSTGPVIMDSSGNIYYSRSGRVYSYTSTGEARWTAAIDAGVVLALETDSTGLATNAAWPRFQGGNAGTGRK